MTWIIPIRNVQKLHRMCSLLPENRAASLMSRKKKIILKSWLVQGDFSSGSRRLPSLWNISPIENVTSVQLHTLKIFVMVALNKHGCLWLWSPPQMGGAAPTVSAHQGRFIPQLGRRSHSLWLNKAKHQRGRTASGSPRTLKKNQRRYYKNIITTLIKGRWEQI